MLQITAKQMKLLDSHMEEAFAFRFAGKLKESFPDRFGEGGIKSAEEYTLACVRHAKEMGLLNEIAISRYAILATVMGLGFETKPFAVSAGLTPGKSENLDPDWLERIFPMVKKMKSERFPS